MRGEPFVSLVTPAYNRGQFLAECIESVLAQTYANWEYIIVNNCSTDETLEVANHYAALDPRIRVYDNTEFLDMNANHNRAFSMISADSKYCKVISADDWLYPAFLERTVAIAESNPSVGIVGSRQLSGGGKDSANWCIRWSNVPFTGDVIPGRDICRVHMLGELEGFGSPTSLLYRADLVRKRKRFFPNSRIHADTSACCMALQESDYAFVQQVLSYERVHEVRVTTDAQSLNSYLPCQIFDVLEYGSSFFAKAELDALLDRLFEQYYRFLAIGALKFRERAFWQYHKDQLNEIGAPLNRMRLVQAIGRALFELATEPRRWPALAAKYLARPNMLHYGFFIPLSAASTNEFSRELASMLAVGIPLV